MKLPNCKALNDKELEQIHQATLEVLNEVGVKIHSKKALTLLEDKGLEVDHNKSIVKFDPETVEKAIRSTPEKFEVFSRDKSYSVKIGIGEDTKTAAGHNGIYIYDYMKNTREMASKKDVGDFAKLANYLDDVDVVATQAYPQDVNSNSTLLHGVDALISNTIKPMLFAPEKDTEVDAVIEILKIITNNNNIGDKPIGICQFSPSSPLFWNTETIDGFMEIAKTGFPCTILPGPITGATAPYTIAGSIVQKNAEILSGIVIAQLVNEGTPLLYTNSGVQFDMRSAAAVFSTPECFIINIASTQLAEYYKIPSHGCIPTSDSHCHDEQLGFENMLSFMSGFESGTSLVVNVGMFSSGKVSSLEQAVVDNEIIKIVRRYLKGLEVNKETLAVDAIKRIGPMGNYLLDELTMKSLQDKRFSTSNIINRIDHNAWLKNGAKTIIQNASAEVEKILKKPDELTLPEDKRKEISIVIDEFENKYK